MIAEPVFDYVGEYDENWPLPEQLTLEQYNHVFFRPDAHFVDGRIVPRILGDWIHSRAIGSLIGALYPVCDALNLKSSISLRLQVSPTRVRVCDFVVLRPDAPHEQVSTVAPLLCIEVIGPEQPPDEELDTLADYLSMGVQNIWLIDPLRRAAFTFEVNGFHETDPANLTVAGTPIRLDLTEAFAAID